MSGPPSQPEGDPTSSRSALSTAHQFALVGFALCLGLFEGPAQIFCGAAVVTTVLMGGLRGWRPGLVEAGIVLWAISGLPGLLGSTGEHSSNDVTRPLMALAFIVGARGVSLSPPRTLERMAWAFGAACVLNGAYGLLQVRFGALPLDRWLLANPESPQIFIPGRVFHERGASGLFYNRLKLAHVGVIGLALMGIVAFRAQAMRRTRVLAGLGGAVLGAGVFYTYARMAMAAWVGAVGALAAGMARAKVALAALGGAGVLGAGLLFTGYGQRRLTSLVEDWELRRAMFLGAISLFEASPILGVGHGVYRSVVRPFLPEALSGVLMTSPHNLWLQVLAETGLVGFSGFNLALFGGLWASARRVRAARHEGTAIAALDRLAGVGLLIICAIGLMHFSLHHASVGLLFWAFLGVAARYGLSSWHRPS